MEQKNVFVIGHKNPDTDSICAAITYANLKNILEENKIPSDRDHFIPKRAGTINPETAFVLNYFGVEEPELLTDVGTQLSDITFRRTEGISSHLSMKKAWELMKILNIVTMPVVDKHTKLKGLIVTGDIATSYMDIYDSRVLAKAKTQYRNIVETLEGKLVAGSEKQYFTKGKVVIGEGSPEMLRDMVETDDLVLLGDLEEAQLACIESNCSCLVVTSGYAISAKVLMAAKVKDVTLISTPYNTFTAARLINQSVPVESFMTPASDVVSFYPDEFVDYVQEVVGKIRHRDFPVVDHDQNYIGMFSRRNLMNTKRKRVILVDHNEKSQAVDNIEEADILEIIDHHRIGSLETIAPVYFRNQPLGCTGTIIYQMYQEKGVEIDPVTAGLLCSEILSDTLMFRSPTCTQQDQDTAIILAEKAGIDVETFAEKMFEAGSDYDSKTEEEILNLDFKVFYSGKISFGVSQVSSMSRQQLERIQKRVTPYMNTMRNEKKLDMLFVMLTHIRSETTYLVYDGANAGAIAADAFNQPPVPEGLTLRGVVSRKKQLIPELIRAISENN